MKEIKQKIMTTRSITPHKFTKLTNLRGLLGLLELIGFKGTESIDWLITQLSYGFASNPEK